MHVVVVDDEVRMVELVTSFLTEAGFTTTACHDGRAALQAAASGTADVMVLDLNLPGVSGLEVCRTLRARGDDLPVLMLTARGAVAERVAGFEAGADDYVVKPFALEELVARVRAIGRRREAGAVEPRRLGVGDVVLDPDEQRVWVRGEETPLTRREFAILAELLQVPGHVVSRQRLFDAVWDGETDIRSNAIEVHMSRLRARLEASRDVVITTLRGTGYRIETRSVG
ncbi:MAG: DNA-binding response regulator [Marmoricola sp.]|nr:DNA-binding response regulator [Marmoricola sp.]